MLMWVDAVCAAVLALPFLALSCALGYCALSPKVADVLLTRLGRLWRRAVLLVLALSAFWVAAVVGICLTAANASSSQPFARVGDSMVALVYFTLGLLLCTLVYNPTAATGLLQRVNHLSQRFVFVMLAIAALWSAATVVFVFLFTWLR